MNKIEALEFILSHDLCSNVKVEEINKVELKAIIPLSEITFNCLKRIRNDLLFRFNYEIDRIGIMEEPHKRCYYLIIHKPEKAKEDNEENE